MKSLISTIEIGGVKDALDILAKAGTEDLFEKAKHQIGDVHPKWPQLKWTDLGGGKFGWRTGTGRGKRGNAGNADGNAVQANSGNAGEQKDLSSHAKDTDTKTLKNVVDSDKAPKDLKDAAKKELQNRGEKTESTTKYSPEMQKLFDAFRINSNKYTDPNKMSIETTPKGNWAIKYDGKRVATIRSLDIDKDELDDLGITIEIPNDEKETTAKTDTTEKKEEKKLRPVGTGTNGPERRKSKHSAFVTKTIDKLKDVLDYKKISDERIEKLADAMSKDESTAKKICSGKFSATGPVSEHLLSDTSTNEVDISKDKQLIYTASKHYDTTSRDPSIRGKYSIRYTIYLKDRSANVKKTLSFSQGGNSRYSTPPAKAKARCIMEALLMYYSMYGS